MRSAQQRDDERSGERALQSGRGQSQSVDAYVARIERPALDWVSLGAKALSSDLQHAVERRAEAAADPTLRTAAALLRCVIAQTPESFIAATRTLHSSLGTAPIDEWPPELRMLAAQAAVIAGDESLLAELEPFARTVSGVLWSARADAARNEWRELPEAATGLRSGAITRWWRIVNEPFIRNGLEPWTLDAEALGDDVFSRIHAPHVLGCSVPAHEQPTVTVVVPTFNPDVGLIATIESLVRQSWQRLEILIVDDTSTEGIAYIAAAAELDDRIRVIRMPENGGAYAARNAGFAEARGEYVTVLDADDLSHPRRIELQVVPLMDHPEAVATGIAGIRMFGDGALTMYGFYTARRNYSAFLFRRRPVLEALGRFDDVRKSGDVEFLGRLTARFGAKSVLRVNKHLSIVQLTANSLSRNDIRYVWLAGERVAYLHQYRGWHRALEAGQDPAAFVRPDRAGRAFAAPATYLGAVPNSRFEVAVLQDWAESAAGLDRESLVRRLPGLADAHVGLIEGVHPRASGPGRDDIRTSTWQWVESGDAEWVPWARETEIGHLLVTDPAYLLAVPDAAFTGARVSRVSVISPSAHMSATPEAALHRDEIDARCLQHFGVAPNWIEEEG
ncbi:glycosyltransferase family 2 protein [Leucobacter musarum]|uniref:glycosyltransferase family 2 protein n=1 Tax=Leucobacter musarum TaxID=1930747 RepID=UPI0006A7CA8C|nr:glycosyltransferase family A protein [Leucobacter musarum]